MRRSLLRIKGLGFILWHTRHEFYHVLLGLMWAWVLREWWQEFNIRWIWWAVVGSLLPDIDHLIYFLTYGRKDWYTQEIKKFFRSKQWRALWLFVESGHKNNTSLASHNFYFMTLLLVVSLLSMFYEWQVGVILFGAMLIHYFFDIMDDLFLLGHVNSNWKRLGRSRARRAR